MKNQLTYTTSLKTTLIGWATYSHLPRTFPVLAWKVPGLRNASDSGKLRWLVTVTLHVLENVHKWAISSLNKGCRRFCSLKVLRYFHNNHNFTPPPPPSSLIVLPLHLTLNAILLHQVSRSLVHLLAAVTSQEKHSPTWLFKLNLFMTPQLINTCPGSIWKKMCWAWRFPL